MTGEKLRFHPSVVLENVVQVAAIIALMFISSIQMMRVEIVMGVLAVLAIAALLLFLRWRRTTVQFNENEIVLERNTVFKMKKSIPYSKIALINVDRGVINRIFGTSKLKVNVNSSKNAMVPEAVMVFKKELADRIKDDLSQHMHSSEPVEYIDEISALQIGPWDVMMHGLFSQSTVQIVSGVFLLGLSVFELYGDVNGGGGFVPLLMFLVVNVLPTIMSMVHYANFKVYRVNDTIYLQHGLVGKYRTSFKSSRINAVRVRSTLASRLFGMSYVEAEVVGLSSDKNSKRPVLCLLKKDAIIEAAMRELVPEFIYERRAMKQPETARYPIAVKAAIVSSLIVLLCVYQTYLMNGFAKEMSLSGLELTLVQNIFTIIGSLLVVATVLWAIWSYRIKEISLGEELFTFVNGVMDRSVTTMSYDKVQIVRVEKGPIARRYGLAIGSVSLLSSIGGGNVISGYFPEEQLDRVHKIVMERMTNGKYDYHKNES
ncbi:MAG: PH domain-containing protein [Methanomassiliicoccales archaeon]|nr:PH domain-containing protein [Methanomassiliicoccales archaeon]